MLGLSGFHHILDLVIKAKHNSFLSALKNYLKDKVTLDKLI